MVRIAAQGVVHHVAVLVVALGLGDHGTCVVGGDDPIEADQGHHAHQHREQLADHRDPDQPPAKPSKAKTPPKPKMIQPKRSSLPKGLQYEGDYDLRGFWKKNPNPKGPRFIRK